MSVERTPLGYCMDCPGADFLAQHIDFYIADTPGESGEKNSAEVVSFPDGLSREEYDEAVEAFSMSDHEAVRHGISREDIDAMKDTVTECYELLGQFACDSDCQGKVTRDDGSTACGTVGGNLVFEKIMKAYEEHIWGQA